MVLAARRPRDRSGEGRVTTACGFKGCPKGADVFVFSRFKDKPHDAIILALCGDHILDVYNNTIQNGGGVRMYPATLIEPIIDEVGEWEPGQAEVKA